MIRRRGLIRVETGQLPDAGRRGESPRRSTMSGGIRELCRRLSISRHSPITLPWADVLTTDWDTLLERAAERAEGYAFETVRFEADLPRAPPSHHKVPLQARAVDESER